MVNRIDSRIIAFAEIFGQAQKELYLVGGAVRDLILGKRPKDWDLTTSALPQEVMEIFPKVIPTGLKHGTVTVLFRGMELEVTTYRSDGDYQDHRKPISVHFTRNLSKDLERRDFTINAIALNPISGELVDRHNGQCDMENRLIRCIGNPENRFDEDALRILRALRFQSQLGFEIEEGTITAMEKQAHLMVHLSIERIRDELFKLLEGENIDSALPSLSRFFSQHGLWPGWEPPSDLKSWTDLLSGIPKQNTLLRRFAFLTAGKGSPTSGNLKNAKLSNEQIKELMAIFYLSRFPWGSKSIRYQQVHFAQKVRELDLDPESLWEPFTRILKYSKKSQPSKTQWDDVFQEVPLETEVKDLKISGDELAEMGIPRNKALGDTLKRLLLSVWDGKISNDKESLKRAVKEVTGIEGYPNQITELW